MSGQQEIQRMVEKELVHAIEAVLNTTKKSKRSPSVNNDRRKIKGEINTFRS
jgi:hypothetical protein